MDLDGIGQDIAEELKNPGHEWRSEIAAKGAELKVQISCRLRKETVKTISGMAERLPLGSRCQTQNPVYAETFAPLKSLCSRHPTDKNVYSTARDSKTDGR